jgi:hypothetical protein
MRQQRIELKQRSFRVWSAAGAFLIGLILCAAASHAASGLPYTPPPVPTPSFRIVPISDGGQHSVDSSWDPGTGVIGAGDSVVAGINNKDEILFRAGSVYRWSGAALTLERRIAIPAPPATGEAGQGGQTGTAASAADAMAAWAINDAGDVLTTESGGLYLVSPGGQPVLIVPNLHPKNLTSPGHGSFTGSLNDQGQVVGDVEVVDAAKAGVNSAHVDIFWQAGRGYNIQDSPVMQPKKPQVKTAGVMDATGTGNPKIDTDPPSRTPPVPIHVYDWNDGPKVDGCIFDACGINDTGDVVAVLLSPINLLQLPVLWDGGNLRIIQTPNGVNGLTPEGINKENDIVGAARLGDENDGPPPPKDTKPKPTEATLVYRRTAFDLNDCIPKDSGWHLLDAVSINDHGEIVGWGTYNDKPMSFLLIPTGN